MLIAILIQRRFTFEVMKDTVFHEPDNGDWSLPLVQKKAGSGKTAQGEDFFGKLDKWFATLEDTYGKDRTSLEWKRFVVWFLLPVVLFRLRSICTNQVY